LGFGIGLTFPVFLLAAQNQVRKDDVGEAGGLIQFLQSLGGAVGLSVLASIQATRFASLDPAPSPACLAQPPQLPLCATFLGALKVSLVQSYDYVFTIMVGLLVVAFLIALFLKGRLPKAAPKNQTSAEAGGVSKPSPEIAPKPVPPLVGEIPSQQKTAT
jgi:hypothetical protein